jgi:hypothetical protein
MKKTLFALIALFAATATFADIVALRPGLNHAPAVRGKIAAAEAVTVEASATVALKSVCSVTAYTNAYRDVTLPHTVYSFTVTNWNNTAAFATNVWDVFAYDDWMTEVETKPGVTNEVSRIVGLVTPTRTNVTESVIFARLPGTTYVVTNDLVSISASSHYGSESPESATYILSGDILVTGAGEDDVVTLLVE